ncbi:type II CRISPR-associated endonuclease Cas1 [Ligilactobacillus saerimneri]|uniref:type II CRISPR-associated endonuclease Cas1 n=1 Tax=Ligilactobacillus saerimneri TaxID=228229 RepID=UPI001C0F8388|nr:type II CRISPR-associated endonuclease Cas1 [Ligilactobacillus saerimneri]MBU5309293.1 type II CRISPR-associated endonuclease Cas1 [Ligilactobacillus saerimneri]MDI9205986.1 type II CRISPR-associated endonuclease Cas1 [Ligilactobacillus saerimneri]
MGWRNLYVTRHTKLSYSLNNLVFENELGKDSIPIDDLDQIYIESTQVVITTGLLSELVTRGIDVIITDGSHIPVGRMEPLFPTNRDKNSITKQLHWEQKRKSVLWEKIISNKIRNQIHVLNFFKIDSKCLEYELYKLQLDDSTNREAVASLKYFPLLFGKGFTRKDTTNSINHALNYGYTVFLTRIINEIVIQGYMPTLGIHHSNLSNKYNFACDLIEPFRPVIDHWVRNNSFIELTQEVRIGLVSALDTIVTYGDKHLRVRNAIKQYVSDCLRFLNGEIEECDFSVEVSDEVSNYETNGDV